MIKIALSLTCFPDGHLLILLLAWTLKVVPPINFHPLTPVQLKHLLTENADGLGMAELEDPF